MNRNTVYTFNNTEINIYWDEEGKGWVRNTDLGRSLGYKCGINSDNINSQKLGAHNYLSMPGLPSRLRSCTGQHRLLANALVAALENDFADQIDTSVVPTIPMDQADPVMVDCDLAIKEAELTKELRKVQLMRKALSGKLPGNVRLLEVCNG